MRNPTDPHLAGPDAAESAADPALQLYQQWQDGQEPDVQEFLLRAGPLSAAQQIAVLRVDQRERWQRGQGVPAETYLQWCPELAGDPERALELVYGEYVLREELGQQPAAGDYFQRFPQYAARLRQQIELHKALEGPASPGPSTQALSISAPEPPPALGLPHLGGYDILGELGRGGMGIVYQARQAGLDRVVALKMILAGVHASAQDLARFRTEAEAIARLQHPNIVQVYEVGEQDGLPFLSLEFCPGGSLERKLDGTPLPAPAAAELIETLARAMHAAHAKGVIHRDLKPANVLLSADGTPKITDFGLARKQDDAVRTGSGAILGTPSYMAPEQASGKVNEMGPATDVYALGAILYECLTGRPPFRAATTLDTVLQVLGAEPIPPSRLQPRVPRDLETICLKCLQKAPSKRYASALALAEDLHRFGAGEPIHARPVGRLERAAKWVKRRPLIAGLLAAVVGLTLAGLVGVSLALGLALEERDRVRAEEKATRAEKKKADLERRRAEKGEAEARRQLGRAQRAAYNLQLAGVAAVGPKDPALAVTLLDDPELCPGPLRDFTWGWLRRQYSGRETVLAQPGPVRQLAFSRDGKLLAVAGRGGRTGKDPTWGGILVWEVATRQKRQAFVGHPGGLRSLAFAPDGRALASCGLGPEVTLWDMTAGGELASLREKRAEERPHRPAGVAFTPDRKFLLLGIGGFGQESTQRWGDVSVWDLATHANVRTLARLNDHLSGIALSPDGKLLAVASKTGQVKVHDLVSGQERADFQVAPSWEIGLTFGPEGALLAVGEHRSLQVWDVRKKQELWKSEGFGRRVEAVAFSPDGKLVASGGTVPGGGPELKLWDATTGKEVRALRGHTKGVLAVAFAPDGLLLASGGSDRTVRLWDLRPTDSALPGPPTLVRGVAISPDGKTLAAGSMGMFVGGSNRQLKAATGEVRLWDLGTGNNTAALRGPWEGVAAVAFSPDSKRVAAGTDAVVRVWERATGRELLVLGGHKAVISCLAWTPDGKVLVSGSLDGTVRAWDLQKRKERGTLIRTEGQVVAMALSPDGTTVATAAVIVVKGRPKAAELKLWDMPAGTERRVLEGQPGIAVAGLAFSPDGKTLAVGSGQFVKRNEPGEIALWDVLEARLRLRLRGHRGPVAAVAFSGDGKTLASAAAALGQGEIKLWDPSTGQERGTLPGHAGMTLTLAFGPKGTLLASGGGEPWRGEVRVWHGLP
jgi:WD40 repeat protein